jgi:hypothetical protein
MKIDSQTSHTLAAQAGQVSLWDTMVSHAEGLKVNAYAERTYVTMTFEGQERKIEIRRHGHDDYRIHGLNAANKALLCNQFGGKTADLVAIGKAFIQYYRNR